jgi:dephospho-CoA kinase
VLRCGLTGGIGSGKSTVAAGLAALGAGLVDADVVARQVLEPGGPAYSGVVERFGPGIVGPDARIDRAALAAVVFADPEARAGLEALTHPAIAERMLAAAAGEQAAGRRVLVVDVPLLDRAGRDRYGIDVVVVVDTPVEVAVARLVAGRGFAEADARARIAAQVSREQRLGLADRVLDNSGDRAALDEEIERTWEWLEGLAAARREGPTGR